ADSVARRLAMLSQYQRAATICVYMSLPDEVPTATIVRMVMADKKRLLVPKVIDTREMIVVALGDTICVHAGQFGIPDPHTNMPHSGTIDLMVIPGRAFDVYGGRQGRGHGYYDRFLTQHPHSYRIGIAYESQLTPALRLKPHDVPMHVVITEKRTLGPFF